MTQSEALDILKTGTNVFLTGAAGAGKTFVLNNYIKHLKDHNIGVGITASTGIAATHIGGMTIHSFVGMGIKSDMSDEEIDMLLDKKYLRDRLDNTDVIIIDEISMLPHYSLELADKICRNFKNINKPFGGMQVVLCGDFFQIPPVRKGENTAQFAYHSKLWKELHLRICYLKEQYRQSDDGLLTILNAIRDNAFTTTHIETLSERLLGEGVDEVPKTRLYSHNADVDRENEAELAKIEGKLFEYRMQSSGNPVIVETMKKSCLAPEILRLKVGAKVMFVKNNFDLGYSNGTIGEIVRLGYGAITVRLLNGEEIDVEQASWIVEDNGRKLAELRQFPLRLAWAITIHKSQGLSLDEALIDLGNIFERGMGYVALSRVRTMEGLTLLGLHRDALRVSDEVLVIDKKMQKESEDIRHKLFGFEKDKLRDIQADFVVRFGRSKNPNKKTKLDTLEETKKLFIEGKTLSEIMEIRELKLGTILDHLEKLKVKDAIADWKHLKKEMSASKWKKIASAFSKVGIVDGKRPLNPVKDIVGDDATFEDLRIVRLTL